MSDPLPGTSNSGAQQPQESRQNERLSKASVSGKHVAAKHQDKHLASEHTDIKFCQARTTEVVQPVYSKMGTELSSQRNPFARHSLPIESGQRVRLNDFSTETLEPKNVRLQIKILKKAIMIAEKKMAEALQNSSRNLSKLFDSIQECYLKGWSLNHLFRQWQFPPPDIKTDEVNQLIRNFEHRFVHFLMACRPPFADQRQDLFFMCVWYLSCKDVRKERDTADFLHICRRSALLFLAAPFKALDQAMAKQRLTKPAKDKVSASCDDLSLIIFFHLAKLSVPGCTYSIHSERIANNIKQQLHSDPLFQGDRKETQYNPTLAELDEHIDTLGALNALDERPPPIPGKTTSYQFSQAKFVIKNIGFNPYQPSSPAIALTVLDQIYRYIRLPDVREDVENYDRMFSQRIDPYNQSLYALLRFLVGDNDDSNIRLIINDDLQYYLKALTHYLKAQWPEAENLAAKSQWSEASWLLGQLCYRRGDLAGSISHLQKAVDRGVDSALLQLANLLLKSPSPDLERVDNLLSEAIDYHRFTSSDTVAMRIYHMTMQLELARGWEEDELFTAPATDKSKAKGKGKGKKRRQPLSSQYLSQPRLAQVNLLCIEALSNCDYDRALQLLVDASQKVSWDFQRATLATMDLWRLTEINCNVDYLHLLHHLAVTEDPSLTIATLRQDSELIRTHGLNQNAPVALTDSVAIIRENTGNWIIKQSLGWLCLLHQTPAEPWRQTPKAQARQQLDNFEHSPALTFTTAMFLTTIASIFKEKCEACNDPDQASDYHGQSLQFFEAAAEFHNWQNLLNSNGRLKARVEAATPTGSAQRLAKTTKSECLNLAERSTEKPEQQPRSDQDDTDKAVERVVIDMVNHAAGDTGNENERPERPERDSNTTVV